MLYYFGIDFIMQMKGDTNMEEQIREAVSDDKVQKRLEELRREVEVGEQRRRAEILTQAGFYEWHNETFGQLKVPYEVSDEQYAQIVELYGRKKALEPEAQEPPFQVEMRSYSENSGAAVFFKIIAFVLWIGGAVLALMTSFVEDRHGDLDFQFLLFLPTVLTYLLYGGAAMCAAELLENVAAIRNALTSIHFKKK